MNQVRVFGSVYRIERCEHVDADGCVGLFEPLKERIKIKAELCPFEEVDTVIHEILHACEYKAGKPYNEDWVRAVATGLTGVFRDNPELLTWIRKKLK